MANLDFLNPQKMQRIQELIDNGAAIQRDPMKELGNRIMGTVNPNAAILPVPKESMMPVPETAKQPESTLPVTGNNVEVTQPGTTPQAQSQLEAQAMSQMQDTSSDQDDMAELQNYLRQNQALIQPYIDAEKAGLAENEQTLKQLQQTPKQVDLSALMNYADHLTGGNISKGYKAPMSEEERLGTIAKLQDMIQSQRRGITSSMAKSLQDKMYGASILGSKRMEATNERFAKKQVENLFGAFQRDKTVLGANEALAGAGTARELLRSGTPVGDRGFVVALARAAGEKGPLSETDVNTWAGSPAVAQRITRQLEKLQTGRLDEVDRKDMEIIIDIMEKRQKAILSNKIDYFSQRVAPRVYGVNTESARSILGADEFVPKPLQATPSGASVKEGTVIKNKEGKRKVMKSGQWVDM